MDSQDPPPLTVWIDGDACPMAVRQIVFRASQRVGFAVRVVANGVIPIPKDSLIKAIRVEAGPNVADDAIVEGVAPVDLVVTADLPLAARVVEKGALAIDIRGQLYSENSVGPRVALRNLLHELRNDGVMLGGPPPFRRKDVATFAATFDRVLTKRLQEIRTGVKQEW